VFDPKVSTFLAHQLLHTYELYDMFSSLKTMFAKLMAKDTSDKA
jgi:hypothetical protein